jgi:hypothetical protein
MSRPLLKAFVASFLVYLLPLVGPHIVLPWGAVVVAELTEGLNRRDPLWIAVDVSLAVTLQLLAVLLGYWYFRRASWKRFLALLPAVPVLWVALMWSYLVAIPRYFLIDANRSPEINTWAEQCRVANAYLPSVKAPADLSLEKAGRAFIARSPNSDLGILQMPGCKVNELGIRWSNYSPRIHSVAATGGVLYSLHNKASDEWTWWVLDGPGEQPTELTQPPHTEHPVPALSTDGQWVAWLQRIPLEKRQTRPALFIEAVQEEEQLTIDLQPFAPSSFRLDHFDRDSGEVVLTRSEEEFVGIGLDGTLRWGPWNPEGVKAWAGTRRQLEDGWVVWDAYREDEPYRLEWSLPEGKGSYTVRRGYRIESVSVDPHGRYIAVGIAGRYRFAMPDSVYVLKTSDGSEVFRRYLPQYNRSQVAFLGSEFFAYKDGKDVSVLRVTNGE